MKSCVLMHKDYTFLLKVTFLSIETLLSALGGLGQLWKPLAELRETLGEPLGGFGSTPKMQSCDKNNFILKI